MTNELFATLGIDLNQPPERVREALEEKNLEYLERLDACTDEARADQLRTIQADIEAAIQGLVDGTLTLPKPAPDATPAPAPQTAQTVAKVDPQTEAALQEGAKRITAQDLPGALEVLKPLADQGDGQGCILTAQVYKLQGDDTNYRRYLFNAAKGGSGDGALLLAQDYFAKSETDQARKWAEKAHELQAPGAGQLLLRLLADEKQYKEALDIVAQELEWLPDFELFALCTDLKKVLEGGAVADDALARTVGPMVRSLSKKPAAQKLLDEPYQAAMDRERQRAAKEAQERKAKELEAQREREEQAREEAESQKKQAEEEAQRKKRDAKRRNQKLAWPVCLILSLILAVVVHRLVGLQAAVNQADIALHNATLLRMMIYPVIAGAICGLVTRLLHHGREGTRFGAILFIFGFSLFANVVVAVAMMVLNDTILKEMIQETIHIGPFVITQVNYLAYGAFFAYVATGIFGIGLADG